MAKFKLQLYPIHKSVLIKLLSIILYVYSTL